MDTEQLKMLLETFAQMGEAGKAAFVCWLFVDGVVPYLAGLCWLLGLRGAALLIIGKIQ